MQAELWVGTGEVEGSQVPGLPAGLRGGNVGSHGPWNLSPCSALPFLLPGGIFKAAYTYCPVSQGRASGCSKDTA